MSTVWLASYPKSGNTWVRALLHALRFGEPDLMEVAAAMEGVGPAPSTGLSLSDVSESEALALRRAAWLAADPGIDELLLRKTHEAWLPASDGTPACWLPGARAVYVVRDPRDVALSWAHHMGVSVAEAIAVMRDEDARMRDASAAHGGYRAASWSTHAASWLDQGDLPVLCVAYEQLSLDPGRELARIAAWLGVEAADDRIMAAVAACSFDSLAAREIVGGFAEAASPGRAFFRRGRAGGWRDELAAELVAEVERDHAVVMARLGYLPASAG